MGDMFGKWVPREWILRVIGHTRKFSKTSFLFLTKNPSRYFEFINHFGENAFLGATIETDVDDNYASISKAPPPSERIRAMTQLKWDKKFVSIEPVMTFTQRFANAIIRMAPRIVYIGYDRYGIGLPEPEIKDVMSLAEKLKKEGIDVKLKLIREPKKINNLMHY